MAGAERLSTAHPTGWNDRSAPHRAVIGSGVAGPSPLAMTYFPVFATGARLPEKYLGQWPGYAAYPQRTSYFLPRPPQR